MNVYNTFPIDYDTIVTIGSFDGMHLGHKSLINELLFLAKSHQLKPYLITFWPHPRVVLPQKHSFKLLCSRSEKNKLLEDFGIDHLIEIPFDINFSKLSAEAFVSQITSQLNPKIVLIGYDHKFGHDRAGSLETFQKAADRSPNSFQIIQFSEVTLDHHKVSSTYIRKALIEGNVIEANDCLGYKYGIEGRVGVGQQIGRTIDIPTANLIVDTPDKLIPKNGVYLSQIKIDGEAFFSVTNIGNKPTFDGQDLSIETHILDYNRDIYGQNVRVELIEYIRSERKFNSITDLKSQIFEDIQIAKRKILLYEA